MDLPLNTVPDQQSSGAKVLLLGAKGLGISTGIAVAVFDSFQAADANRKGQYGLAWLYVGAGSCQAWVLR